MWEWTEQIDCVEEGDHEQSQGPQAQGGVSSPSDIEVIRDDILKNWCKLHIKMCIYVGTQ